jgi:hypothetical protein
MYNVDFFKDFLKFLYFLWARDITYNKHYTVTRKFYADTDDNGYCLT